MNPTTNDDDMNRPLRIHSMIKDGEGVNSGYLHQALTFSLQWADAYTNARCFEKAGMTPVATATLASARLEWVLHEGRSALNNVITVDDFNVLCNTFLGEIALPEDYASLATPVADEFGLEPDTYEESGLAPLLDKLMGLSLLQRIALRDLVERFWYVGKVEFSSYEAFLKANGIDVLEQ